MTNEQAIRGIRAYRELMHHAQPDNPFVEVLDMAEETLEKQIPQKPNPPTDKYHADTCAVCGGEVVTEQRFCGNCGQAISWEGEDSND